MVGTKQEHFARQQPNLGLWEPFLAVRSVDLNRLLTHLRMWSLRHLGGPLVALWVWHSDVTGRNPHVHVFMHLPSRRRDELHRALVASGRNLGA